MEFNSILDRLKELKKDLIKPQAKSTIERIEFIGAIDDAAFCMRNYIEPWRCHKCKGMWKVPQKPEKPRWCPSCQSDECYPYPYHELARMDSQLRILLNAVRYYSKQQNGNVAVQTLQELGSVDPKPKTGLQPQI